MAGVGLGGFIIPQVARAAIDGLGWRGGYVVLGMLTIAIAFPAVALWVREPRPGEGERRAVAGAASGLTVREAVRTVRFWLLGGTFFLVALGIVGMQVISFRC